MSFPISEIPITIDAKSPQPSEYIRWTDHPQARTFEGLLPFSSCKILKIPPSLEDFPLYTFDTLSAHTSQFSSSSIIQTFSSFPRHHRTSLVSVFAAIRYPLSATRHPVFQALCRSCGSAASFMRRGMASFGMNGVGGIVGPSSPACLLLSLVCVSFSHFRTRCLSPFSSLLSFFPPTPRRLIKIVFTMKHFLPASLLSLVIPAAHTAGAVDPAVVIVGEQI